MMSDFKRSLKMFRYGYALKSSILACVLFAVLGIATLCLHSDQSALAGIVYIICGALMPMQVHYYLLYANIVSASPRRKLLELTIPNVISAISGILGYAALLIGTIAHMNTVTQDAESNLGILFLGGLIIAALLMCFGAAYKYFVLSMLFFFFIFIVLYGGGVVVLRMWNLNLDIYEAAGISLLFVVVGIALSCVLRSVFYKKPLSKIAAGASLRKAMQ